MQESYAAAMSWMKKAQNHGKTCQWDGGEGWVCEGYYCPQRKRVISRTWNPKTENQPDQFCRWCQQHFGPNTNRP